MYFAYFQNFTIKVPVKLKNLHEIPWNFWKHNFKMLGSHCKNSAKRDTRPLKGCDLTHKCLLRENLKRTFSRKNLEWGWWVKFLKGLASSAGIEKIFFGWQPKIFGWNWLWTFLAHFAVKSKKYSVCQIQK